MFGKILVFVLLLISVAMLVDADAVVEPCNEVCPRIQRERDECCRAHGYRGGMVAAFCLPLFGRFAFCKN